MTAGATGMLLGKFWPGKKSRAGCHCLFLTLSHTLIPNPAPSYVPPPGTPPVTLQRVVAPLQDCAGARGAGSEGRRGRSAKVAPPAGAQVYANIAGALLAMHQRVSSAGRASAVATEPGLGPPT